MTATNPAAPYLIVRTEKLLKMVGFDWRKHVDQIERVKTAESYRLSLEMSRAGIIVGPS